MASLAAALNAHVASLYDARANELAERYASVSFAQVHDRLAAYFPTAPALVLDVGSGGGRDAIALTRMGHRVVAAEPAGLLRARAIDADPTGLVTWIDDDLPALRHVRALGLRFDFVLCSAVLIHLPKALLASSLASMGMCLAPTGRMAVTVRPRDEGECETLFHTHRPAAIKTAFDAAGLVVVDCWQATDALGRARTWDSYVAVQRT